MTSSEPSELNRRSRNSNGTSTSGTEIKTEESQPHQHTANFLIKLKSYLIALRVWSLSASIIPTILGELISIGSF